MLTTLAHLFVALLLCQCATKHQPLRFEPRFLTEPEDFPTSEKWVELKELEENPNLSQLQKKRLYDLYLMEGRTLRPGTPRYIFVDQKVTALRAELKDEIEKMSSFQKEVDKANELVDEKQNFENSRLKREYVDIRKLWNRDENELALQRITKLLNSDWAKSGATQFESLRLLNLWFRIAYDMNNYPVAEDAYAQIKLNSDCSTEAAQAGFLIALQAFSQGQLEKAGTILSGQCDPDTSLSNRVKRAYWMYRFSEPGSEKAASFYQELMSYPFPGYYAFLAKAGKGETLELPEPRGVLSFGDFKVSREVEGYLRAAEERIRVGLRKDAIRYLQKATIALRPNAKENVEPLIYVACLFQSAGQHLEAMKTVSLLISGLDPKTEKISPLVETEFNALFARPYSDKVDWLGKIWNVDSDFIYSIMRQESAFNPGATSTVDAKGLMQMMPSLAKYLVGQWGGIRPSGNGFLYKGKENLSLSVFHLHQLKSLLNHPALIAGAYNAGINRVSGWWRKASSVPLDVFVETVPITETRNYIKLVLRNYIYYRGQRNSGSVTPSTFDLKIPPYPGSNYAVNASQPLH